MTTKTKRKYVKKEAPVVEETDEISEEDKAFVAENVPDITEDTISDLDIAIAKIKELEGALAEKESVLPTKESMVGAVTCPDCGAFTKHKVNALTYHCDACSSEFHPPKPEA